MLLIFFVPFLLLIAAVFFLISQQQTLQAVQKVNRRMAPGLVWLQCIPFFGWAWQFVVVISISNAIRREFLYERNDSVLGIAHAAATEDTGKRPTLGIGLAFCVFAIAGELIIGLTGNGTIRDQLPGLICAFAGLTCWIIYWVSLIRYRKQLQLFQP